MTILMTTDMPGVDEAGYEHLAAALMTRLRAADGFITHAAGPIDGGYRVTELWNRRMPIVPGSRPAWSRSCPPARWHPRHHPADHDARHPRLT